MLDEMVVERWRLRIRQVGVRVKIEARTTAGWRLLEVLPMDEDWRHDELISYLRDLAAEYAGFLEDYRAERWSEDARAEHPRDGVLAYRHAIGAAR